MRSCQFHHKNHHDNNDYISDVVIKYTDDQDDDSETPPLLSSCLSCKDDCALGLFVSFIQMLGGLHRLFLDLIDDGFLNFDHDAHLTEEVGEFGDCPFNLLNILVSGLNFS